MLQILSGKEGAFIDREISNYLTSPKIFLYKKVKYIRLTKNKYTNRPASAIKKTFRIFLPRLDLKKTIPLLTRSDIEQNIFFTILKK
jgi:hypothetical protein